LSLLKDQQTLPVILTEKGGFLMKTRKSIVWYFFVLLVIAGCASTKVSNREQLVYGQLPRPSMIWVYNFAATSSDVPADSAWSGQFSEQSQSQEQIAEGRQVGSEIASQLVAQIQDMGMPAAVAVQGTMPQVNDLVIRGYLVSVDQGSAARRIVVGFGSGASELDVAVEGYQETPQGLRELGQGTVSSESGKTPGGALGLATLLATHNPAGLIISTGAHLYGEKSGKSTVEGRAKQTAKKIADVLKQRFEEQGWIE
jgi:hypothetical protein